jgi:hypothetical protein
MPNHPVAFAPPLLEKEGRSKSLPSCPRRGAPQGRGGGSCGGGHVADRVVESTRGGCAVRLLTELRQLDTHSERTLVSFATAIMVFDDAVLVDDPYFARASR